MASYLHKSEDGFVSVNDFLNIDQGYNPEKARQQPLQQQKALPVEEAQITATDLLKPLNTILAFNRVRLDDAFDDRDGNRLLSVQELAPLFEKYLDFTCND